MKNSFLYGETLNLGLIRVTPMLERFTQGSAGQPCLRLGFYSANRVTLPKKYPCATSAAEPAATGPAVHPLGRRRSQGGHAQPTEEPDPSTPAAQAAQATGLYSAHARARDHVHKRRETHSAVVPRLLGNISW